MKFPTVVLHVRRTDVVAREDQGYDDFVLVSVQAIGPQPLDLKLLGTESENVYATSIRHQKIEDLRLRPAYEGSDAEWEAILMRVLLENDEPDDGAAVLDNIEIVSAVSDGRIDLTLRKNIAGVAQRIGAIQLREDNDQEISLFHWTAAAARQKKAAQKEKEAAQATIATKNNEILRYKEHCANLVQAKLNHEAAVIAKFVELQRAKKLKIRDLQRLLARAKVDPVAAAAVQGARKSTRGRSAGPSRPNKRAASSNGADFESDQDSSFETRKPKPAEDHDDDEDETDDADVTPDNSDQDKAGHEHDGATGHVAPVPGAAKPGEGAKKKAIESVAGNGNSREQREPDSLPPRRDLPFTRRNGQSSPEQQQQPGKAPAADEDENDTTEDEL